MIRQLRNNTYLPEVRHSLTLSLPLILTNLVQISTNFVSTLMVAHLGGESLAANVLGALIYGVLITFCSGFFSSVNVLVSHSYGAQDSRGVKLSLLQGLWSALILSLIAITLLNLARLLLVLTSENLALIALASSYLKGLTYCILPLNILMVIEQFLIGVSKTRIIFLLSLVQVPLEIFAIYVFIYGKFGAPQFGLAGIGYAMAIVFILEVIIVLIYINLSASIKQYKIFSLNDLFDYRYFKETFCIGYFIGLTNIIEISFMVAIAIMIGYIGYDALASYQVTRQLWMISFILIISISQVTNARVGYLISQNDKSLIKRAIWANAFLVSIFTVCIALSYLLIPEKLFDVIIDKKITDYDHMLHFAILFFTVNAFSQVFDGFRFVILGSLRGLKDTRMPMYISFFAFWCVGFPTAYLLAFVCQLGAIGLWLSLLISIIISSLILTMRLLSILTKIDLTGLLIKNT